VAADDGCAAVVASCAAVPLGATNASVVVIQTAIRPPRSPVKNLKTAPQTPAER
jgi:hypothetical protein